MRVKIADIIRWAEENAFELEYFGEKDLEVVGFSSLKNYKDESLTWINLNHPVEEDTLHKIRCAILQKGVTQLPKNYFVTSESKRLFFAILEHFFSDNKRKVSEKHNTYIGQQVTLGKNVIIGCNCVLDGDIRIGKGTVIEHNVVIMNRVTIGENCIIHSSVVIGKDGFGYSFDKDNIPQKVRHFGGVRIGDRVEIGSFSVVDRGTIDDTIVGDDVKIDSHSAVAHNAEVGNASLIVKAVLEGSSKLGEKSYMAPGSAISNQKTVGKNCFLGQKVVVSKPVKDNHIIVEGIRKPILSDDYRVWL